jgi:hypothetical protein
MDLGDTLVFTSDLYNAPPEDGGVLVNAVTAALTITLPDGTTVTPTITNPPAVTGKYTYHYVTSPTGQSGRYTGQWLFTMSGGETTSYVQTFDVGASLVTIDEALTHLRAAGVVRKEADLGYLQRLTYVATDAVETVLGRIITPRTFTEYYDGGNTSIALRHTPVISITTVTEWGATLTVNDYVLNQSAGVLYRGTGPYLTWGPLQWAGWGRQSIVVVYRAGMTSVPYTIRQAALTTVQSLWQETQPGRPLPTDIASMATGMAQAALPDVVDAAFNSKRLIGFA